MNNKFTAVILAAGAGTRMKSTLPKAMQKVCGRSMIDHVIDVAYEAGCDDVIVVTGVGREKLEEHLSQRSVPQSIRFVIQEQRLGTGHALKMASPLIDDDKNILVLCADAPLLKTDTLKRMILTINDNNVSGVVLTAMMDNPDNYGRIIRNTNKQNFYNDNGNSSNVNSNKFAFDADVIGIVEHKDANEEQKLINEINTGVYAFNGKPLKKSLENLKNDNVQGEYYLTDVVLDFHKKGLKMSAIIEDEPMTTIGVNSPKELHVAERYMQVQIVEKHMENGVRFINADTVVIEKSVVIDSDTLIYPNVVIKGDTKIGTKCIIGIGSRIENSVINDNVCVETSVILDSSVDSGTNVGPFAYIRPNSHIGKNVKVGDFVEIKNSTLGDDTKVSHLTYVGDGDVGNKVNIGCGVVFVNYDGVNKYRTTIKDDCFIGCNSNLISPVNIEEGAYIAAGTTVTRDVPKDSLTLGRVRQENKEGRAKTIRRLQLKKEKEK